MRGGRETWKQEKRVSEGGEVRHHVPSGAAVDGRTRRQQDDEVEQLEDVRARLVDRQQDQAVPPSQAGQGDDQVVGREAVQPRQKLNSDADSPPLPSRNSSDVIVSHPSVSALSQPQLCDDIIHL
ncbi:hypothetical protein EYF80_025446 [Liparis tanakae]|uniref:Uncharacterized protein n=1 Tax=Liparis tanakae TaxID=230148 RepID=A0A4Z2HF38_9TELE|nr:hypothetical protein EYF80_025446 [Liparis tanakae]